MTDLTEDALEALRSHLDPDDRTATPFVLEAGTSNLVVQFGGSVVRVARNDHAAAGHQREVALLPVLVDRLPVSVPAPYRLVLAQPSLPHGAVIHRLLPGRVMTPSDVDRDRNIVGDIARTLSSLHGIGPELFPVGVLRVFDPIHELQNTEQAVGPWLQPRLRERQWRRLNTWWKRSEHVLSSPERVVCHADAWYGNMLVAGGRLIALLDWEDACLADPALDLAPQQYLGPQAAAEVIGRYVELRGPTEGLEDRIACFRLLRELGGLAYVLKQGMDEEYEDGVAKIAKVLDDA